MRLQIDMCAWFIVKLLCSMDHQNIWWLLITSRWGLSIGRSATSTLFTIPCNYIPQMIFFTSTKNNSGFFYLILRLSKLHCNVVYTSLSLFDPSYLKLMAISTNKNNRVLLQASLYDMSSLECTLSSKLDALYSIYKTCLSPLQYLYFMYVTLHWQKKQEGSSSQCDTF